MRKKHMSPIVAIIVMIPYTAIFVILKYSSEFFSYLFDKWDSLIPTVYTKSKKTSL